MLYRFEEFNERVNVERQKTRVMVGDRKLKDLPYEEIGENFAFFYMKEGNFLFPKGKFYLYFLDTDQHAKQMQAQTGEIEFLFFPFRRRFDMTASPIDDVWKKSHAGKGTQHILGIIEGQIYDDEKIIMIQMMSVRPGFKFNRINSFMVDGIQEWKKQAFDTYQIAFDNPTDEGLQFILSYDKNMMIWWSESYRPKTWKELKDSFANVHEEVQSRDFRIQKSSPS